MGQEKCHDEWEIGDHNEKTTSSRLVFFRQLFICSGVYTIYFVLGLCYGAPTVFIPAIRREANSTEVISEDMASWLCKQTFIFSVVAVYTLLSSYLSTFKDNITTYKRKRFLASIHGYSAIPWIITLPTLIKLIGRRKPFMVVCVSTIAAFSLFYFSSKDSNPTLLLISEVMEGMLISSNMILLIVIVTEYTSPKYRGIFMTVKSTIFFWGVWIANATGTFSHWKYIAVIAFVMSTYSLTAFFWPESPSWLAMKGRYRECAVSHRWLKGNDDDSENELKNLINAQKEYLNNINDREKSVKHSLRYFINTFSTKAFYKPLLLSMMTMSLYNFTGKFVCTMYSIDLIKNITNSESTAYMGMLIIELVTIFSMQFGCFLSKYLKRRTMLLGSSSIGICFLFIISLYLYLVKLQVIVENKFVSILLLTLFSMTVSCGPMIMACSVYGELTPLRYKSSSLPLLAIFSEFLMGTVLKVSPYIFKHLDLHGAFLFYALSASVFVVLLYFHLPESKDKTLQEIEEYFKQTPKLSEQATTLNR